MFGSTVFVLVYVFIIQLTRQTFMLKGWVFVRVHGINREGDGVCLYLCVFLCMWSHQILVLRSRWWWLSWHTIKKKALRTTQLSHLHTAGITDCVMTHTHIHTSKLWSDKNHWASWLSGVTFMIIINTHLSGQRSQTVLFQQQTRGVCSVWKNNLQANMNYRHAYVTYLCIILFLCFSHFPH